MEFFPVLHTERLLLRKLTADDISSLVKYGNNKKVSDYVFSIPHPYEEPDAVFRISYVLNGFRARSRFVFAVILLETAEFVGEVSLHLDNTKVSQLGYWIGEPFWNKGIATEAVRAVCQFGFKTLDLEKIYGTCHLQNIASSKVLERNGMVKISVTSNIAAYSINRSEMPATF